MIKKRKETIKIPTAIPNKLCFPMIFWESGSIFKVFHIPHNVDKVKARRAIQQMLNRNRTYKFML